MCVRYEKVFAIIKFTFPSLKTYKYMSTVSSTFDTDLAQRRSNARLAAPERKRDVDRGRERERKNEREILGESLREDR